MMQVTAVPDKVCINRTKHGISIAALAEIDLNAPKVIPDERYDDGGARRAR